MITVTDIGH